MDGEIGALLTAQGPDPMVRSPVTGAVNIAVISAAVHALTEQFDDLGLHEAASGWEHEGSENWSTEQRLQVDTLLHHLEGLRSSMNEVLHDPDPSALRASLSDGMLEQALTADVLSGDETIAVQVGVTCIFLLRNKTAWFFQLFSSIFLCFLKASRPRLSPPHRCSRSPRTRPKPTLYGARY